jgi:putative Mg2+ transporter-C (MgtC) family protein
MIGTVGHVGAGTTALRLGLGAVFGGVIGLERELEGHDAGVRTHLLLALGSALFGVLSVGAFGAFILDRNATDISFDPSRVASYVAAGIGFLGGGVILKQGDHVKGLTTAASLWTAAAVGLACGLGLWAAAGVASGLASLVLCADVLARWLRAKVAPSSRPPSAPQGGAGPPGGNGQAARSRSKNDR